MKPLTEEASPAHAGVLNGRSNSSRNTRAPVEEKSADTASAHAGLTEKIFIRGEKSMASVTSAGEKRDTMASASPAWRKITISIAVLGRPP